MIASARPGPGMITKGSAGPGEPHWASTAKKKQKATSVRQQATEALNPRWGSAGAVQLVPQRCLRGTRQTLDERETCGEAE